MIAAICFGLFTLSGSVLACTTIRALRVCVGRSILARDALWAPGIECRLIRWSIASPQRAYLTEREATRMVPVPTGGASCDLLTRITHIIYAATLLICIVRRFVRGGTFCKIGAT